MIPVIPFLSTISLIPIVVKVSWPKIATSATIAVKIYFVSLLMSATPLVALVVISVIVTSVVVTSVSSTICAVILSLAHLNFAVLVCLFS